MFRTLSGPMMIDVARARRDTPACEEVLHFNNAGAALMPQPVIDAVRRYFTAEAARGGYETAAEFRDELEGLYQSAGRLLNCRPDEIAVLDSATRAWDMAFYGIPFAKGDRILTAAASYASNYIAFLQVAARTGATVEVVPSDPHGQIAVDALERMMDERVKLIALTHVPTNGGLVNPAAAVGAVARRHGTLYLLDACQSVGQMPVDVDAIDCDMLSTTSRKYLRGPRGVGLLYVRRSRLSQLEPPMLDLRAATWVSPHRYRVREDARRFEAWEGNMAARYGLAVAIDYALEWDMEAVRYWVQTLADLLRERLGGIAGATVRDLGEERCGIVSFTLDGWAPVELRTALRERGIHVEVTTAASTLIDMDRRGIEEMMRASVHYYNTEAEVERFCAVLDQLQGRPARS